MNTEIKGGIDIAMKVPPHQYQQTLDFYRQTLRLPEITDKAPATGFILGPNRLWIDEAPGISQAEVWLERSPPIFTPRKSISNSTASCAAMRLSPCRKGLRGDGS